MVNNTWFNSLTQMQQDAILQAGQEAADYRYEDVYKRQDRPLKNADTYRKICDYLRPAFLENLLNNYIRQDFLKGI